jgi:hypothetical protein
VDRSSGRDHTELLLHLDEWLDVSGCDRLHRLAESGDVATPTTSAATRLKGHCAGRESWQGEQKAGRGAASCVRPPRPCCKALELENGLGETNSDGAHLIQGSLPELSSTRSLQHTEANQQRPRYQAYPHQARSDLSRLQKRPQFWARNLSATLSSCE